MVPSVLSILIAILTPDTNNSLKKACTIRNDLIGHPICPYCQWVEYHKDDSNCEYQVACESVKCHFCFLLKVSECYAGLHPRVTELSTINYSPETAPPLLVVEKSSILHIISFTL